MTSAIWLCNDRDTEIRPKCAVVADYAESIAMKCMRTNGWDVSIVQGQQFGTAEWNVIVRHDDWKC